MLPAHRCRVFSLSNSRTSLTSGLLFQVDVDKDEDTIILRQVQMFFRPWKDDEEYEDLDSPDHGDTQIARGGYSRSSIAVTSSFVPGSHLWNGSSLSKSWISPT
jgi:hypothetical protein